MARPLGRYQYYPEATVEAPRRRRDEDDDPKRDDEDDDEREAGGPAKMPVRPDRVSPAKGK